MTLLKECVEKKKFDVRLIEKNIARGYVTEKESEDHFKGLPDDSQNAEWVNVDELTNQEEKGTRGFSSEVRSSDTSA